MGHSNRQHDGLSTRRLEHSSRGNSTNPGWRSEGLAHTRRSTSRGGRTRICNCREGIVRGRRRRIHKIPAFGQSFPAPYLLRPPRMRMSTCAILVCVLTLLATPAAAQSTTEEGIRAVLRGDYQAAARILKPLADDAARPDPVAQFFLAVLYHTGLGCQARRFTRLRPVHEGRSARSAVLRNNPRRLPSPCASSSALGRPCSVSATRRWQGGPPQSFLLGPSIASCLRTRASPSPTRTRKSGCFKAYRLAQRSCRSSTHPCRHPAPQRAPGVLSVVPLDAGHDRESVLMDAWLVVGRGRGRSLDWVCR